MLLLVLPSFALVPKSARAQDAGARIYYVRERQFFIPFDPVPTPHLVKQVQLFVSADQGRRWDPFAIAPPEQRRFHFTSQADGLYWFVVQTVLQDGKLYPASLDGIQPSLKVVVDTIPPMVNLRPLTPRNGEVGVSWEIRDEYFDENNLDAVRLEYRTVGGTTWTPLARRGLGPQLYWNPENNGVLEVRVRARDRAGNWGEATTNVSLDARAAGLTQPATPTPPAEGTVGGGNPAAGALDPDRRMVNTKSIQLNFEIKEKGPSGISTLELWFTQDGRSWNKYPLPQPKGDGGLQSPLTVPVAQEGVYGFTLVARSGVGLGERPPQIGDRPQIWVEVDLTKPVVQLQGVVVGKGKDKGKLFIGWTAYDKNLDKAPIMISYAEQAAGPWTPITADRIPNNGRYVWSMPQAVPYQFLIKVEAVDRAGNVGEAVTSELVKVDLSQPKARILTVAPGGGQ
jgi:hypothetical protein